VSSADGLAEAELVVVADGYVIHAGGTVCGEGCQFPGHEVAR
jgi:hypothetical protein